jgi:hypothetical protein
VSVYKYPADIRIYRRGKEIARHPRLIDQRALRSESVDAVTTN